MSFGNKVLFWCLDQLKKKIERKAKGKIKILAAQINRKVDIPILDEEQEEIAIEAALIAIIEGIKAAADLVE